MSVAIKINGQPFDFPVDVNEITNKQFFGIFNAKDILDEISVITGIERSEIENFKNFKTVEVAQALMRTLAGSIAAGFDGTKLPKSFVIDGKTIDIPKELRLEPIGAFMSVHDILATHVNEETEKGVAPESMNFTSLIPKVLAHYFFKPFYGDNVLYSEEAAEKPAFMEKIMNCNFVASVQVGNFFFRNIGRLT